MDMETYTWNVIIMTCSIVLWCFPLHCIYHLDTCHSCLCFVIPLSKTADSKVLFFHCLTLLFPFALALSCCHSASSLSLLCTLMLSFSFSFLLTHSISLSLSVFSKKTLYTYTHTQVLLNLPAHSLLVLPPPLEFYSVANWVPRLYQPLKITACLGIRLQN